MTPHRSESRTLLAAFLLGGILALIAASPGRAGDLFRLDRVAAVRFSPGSDGKLRRQEGVLLQNGVFNARPGFEVDRPANTPDWALNREVITVTAWRSYRALGIAATTSFTIFGGAWFFLGDEQYYLVGPDPEAAPATGPLINLSTRARLAASSDTLVAGFVIEDLPRIVLLRAVGPGLARFGVASPVSDPKLTLRRNGQLVHANDNWSDAIEAEAMREVTPRLGAFALEPNSRDAARLVLLEPGAYTVEVSSATALAGGDVLVEVYSVPDDLVALP